MHDLMRTLAAVAAGLTLAGTAAAQKGAEAKTAPTPAPKQAATQKKATTPAKKPTPAPSPAASPAPAPSPSPAAGPTPAPAPTPPPVTVVVQAPAPAEPPRSDLVSGWLGLAILVAGGFFAWRWASARGMTVTGAFRKLGVDTAAEVSAPPPARPQAPPPPPLPSLADLPPAGPAAAPASAAPGAPRLVGIAGPIAGRAFPLDAAVTLGREADNTVVLDGDSTASRHHARIDPTDNGWVLSDCGSSNGTFVNGQRIAAAQPLRPGDEIQAGAARLRFEGRG